MANKADPSTHRRFRQAAGPASAATFFKAVLTGEQEVAPAGATASPLTGEAHLELLDLGGGDFSLAYDLFLPAGPDYQFLAAGTPVDDIPDDPLAVTRLHIHNAPRGANGPVVYGIFNPDQDVDNDVVVQINSNGSADVTGSWGPGDGAVSLSGFVPALMAAQPGEDLPLYFNLHTVADPAGLIRGQIFATVAEPATLGLGLLGLFSLGLMARRRVRAD